MKKRVPALFCALLLLLAACAPKEAEVPEGAWRVWFAVSGERAAAQSVDFEYHSVDPEADPIKELVSLLLSGPTAAGLGSPFPQGVRLLSAELGEDGTLTLDLSEQYDGLPGVYLTVANACFVLTLSQVPGVENVTITVEGKPLPYQTIRALRESDLILSGAEEETVSVNALLYFPREGGALGGEYRDVVKTEDASLPAAVVSALLEGPRYEGLISLMPEGTVLRSAKIENGVCRLDLSQPFVDHAPQQAEAKLVLYSIVNTLCALSEVSIDSVQLTVEGQSVAVYGGVPALNPLEPDYSLIGK